MLTQDSRTPWPQADYILGRRWFAHILLAVISLSLFANVETARTFPSWFDEAFFANIAFNLAHGHGFLLDLIPEYSRDEVLVYGPVYFWIQALVIKTVGLHAPLFRLLNLSAAYLSIWFLVKFLRLRGVGRTYCFLCAIAVLADVSFNRNSVSGRMDMLAVMFVAAALSMTSVLPKGERKSTFAWLGIGGLCAAAFLTTPRALFLLPVVVISGLETLHKEAEAQTARLAWRSFLTTVVAFALPVAAWIAFVGGPREYASLFLSNHATAGHIAPSFFRSAYDNVAIGLMLGLVAFNLKRVSNSVPLCGLVLTYLMFSLFVKEVGPYAAMVTPLVLAAVFMLLSMVEYKSWVKICLGMLVIAPGILLLGLRAADVFLNSNCRDARSVSAKIDAPTLGPRDKFIAPFKYYFLLERTGRVLQTAEYSPVGFSKLSEGAARIITEGGTDEDASLRQFDLISEWHCLPRKLPLLPESYYQRSTFHGQLYGRP